MTMQMDRDLFNGWKFEIEEFTTTDPEFCPHSEFQIAVAQLTHQGFCTDFVQNIPADMALQFAQDLDEHFAQVTASLQRQVDALVSERTNYIKTARENYKRLQEQLAAKQAQIDSLVENAASQAQTHEALVKRISAKQAQVDALVEALKAIRQPKGAYGNQGEKTAVYLYSQKQMGSLAEQALATHQKESHDDADE